MTENVNMCAQFQHIFCKFAELGVAARLYLLKNGSLLRFLKLVL